MVAPRLHVAAMLAGTAMLLTLSAAPLMLWPLAWIALAPMFVVAGQSASVRRAALAGAATGVLYFAMNLWWLWTASIPGAVAIILIFGCYWGIATGLIHWLGLVSPPTPVEPSATANDPPIALAAVVTPRVFAIAVMWVALEWLRCRLFVAFPWMPLGATQTPLTPMCQVADLGGPWIVSFWVALVNALAAISWTMRARPRALSGAGTAVTAVLTLTAAYGAWRLATTPTSPGPRVMVLQSNFATLPGGGATVSPEELVRFSLDELRRRLSQEPVDLAVVPEASFPPINEEARRNLAPSAVGPFLQSSHDALVAISQEFHVALLVGGNAVTGWNSKGKARVGSEIRNSAYFYNPSANAVVERYDKIHLVSYCECLPFSSGPAWLQRLAMSVAANRASQPMHPGSLAELRPFRLTWRPPDAEAETTTEFITPICLENIDPRIIAEMIRTAKGGGAEVGFIANLSSDGWFATQEKHQHFQLLALRCIENRLPMVRSSNTGVSGFIDSVGREVAALPANEVGALTHRIELDGRQTIYARYGDAFAVVCVALTCSAIAARFVRPRIWGR